MRKTKTRSCNLWPEEMRHSILFDQYAVWWCHCPYQAWYHFGTGCHSHCTTQNHPGLGEDASVVLWWLPALFLSRVVLSNRNPRIWCAKWWNLHYDTAILWFRKDFITMAGGGCIPQPGLANDVVAVLWWSSFISFIVEDLCSVIRPTPNIGMC